MKDDLYTLYQLSIRGVKLFLKDKATVFFSLLAPLIVLILYVLFLGDLQIESVKSAFPPEMGVSETAIKAYVDSWMIAGVLAISCITVSISANNQMVKDKETNVINDCLVSPIKNWVITASYFVMNFIITLSIVLVVALICLMYLAISGEWYMTAGDVFAVIGIIILSALSATAITVFISGFFKTESSMGAFIGIASAVLGFVIGAYMPMSVMPKTMRYISGVFPGSHSAGLFRSILMKGSFENLSQSIPEQAAEGISQSFSMSVDFFGKDFGITPMMIYLVASIVIFAIINVTVFFRKKRR